MNFACGLKPQTNRSQRKPLSMLNIPKASDKSFADGKILQTVNQGVGVITFNNPEKRNAMSLDMWEGLGHALIELRDDPDVRVIVMSGYSEHEMHQRFAGQRVAGFVQKPFGPAVLLATLHQALED